MQVAPPLNEVPYDEYLSAVESEPPCAALSGLSAIWTLNPGLAPWAVLLDPFGVLGFGPETRLEVDLEPELHPPGLVELGLDAPEIGIIDIAAAGIESRPIEQVEQLPA